MYARSNANAKVEYMASALGATELLWLKILLKDTRI